MGLFTDWTIARDAMMNCGSRMEKDMKQNFFSKEMEERKRREVYDYLEARQKMLARFATRKKLRIDWHEPDEDGVTAVVMGKSFDNAFGDDGRGMDGKYIEKVVILRDEHSGEEVRINLATLFAIATYKLRYVRPISDEE